MATNARITINTSDQLAKAVKKRAGSRFQSVSKYVEELVSRDLGLTEKPSFMVEETQAPYGEKQGAKKLKN